MSSFCNVCGTIRSPAAPQIRTADHTRRDPALLPRGTVEARVRELTSAAESQRPAWFEPLIRKSGRTGSPSAVASDPAHTHHEGTDVTWDVHHRDHNNLRFVSSLRREGAVHPGRRAESGSSESRQRFSTSPVPAAAAALAAIPSHRQGVDDLRGGGGASTSAHLVRLEDQIVLLSDHTEWCRRGFLDLCHAVRDDFRTIREEVDARFHQLEQTLLIAVSDAVSREQRYRELIHQSDWMTTSQRAATSPPPVGLPVPEGTTAQPLLQQQQKQQRASATGSDEVLLRDLGARIAALEATVAVMGLRHQHHPQQPTVERRSSAAALSATVESSTANGGTDEQLRSHAHHVHTLTAAHQQLMQTLLDERCAALQSVFESKLRTLEVQMADLRGRVNAQSSEHREAVYRLYRDLSGDTAAPPPQGNT